MKLIVTSGRTIQQGAQLYSKDSREYTEETSCCFIHPLDLFEMNVENGEHVLIKSVTGETVFKVISNEDVQVGMVFLPCGPHANYILHSHTHGTGAPDYKWIDVEVTPTDQPIRPTWDLLEDEGGLRLGLSGSQCPTIAKADVVIHDVTCSLCGCLCDDLTANIKNNQVDSIENGCLLSAGKYTARGRLMNPVKKSGGKWNDISYDEAIQFTADMLLESERPLLFGWSGTSCEAQCLGINIAEAVSGTIDNCSSICHGPSIMAIQEVGHPGCTLGQVKNRADLIIYWGANPLESHPRHMSRYTTYPDGYFVENGRKDRKVIVVDIRNTETARAADEFIQIKPGGDYAVFGALRAIVRGKGDVVPAVVAGVKRETLFRLAETCKNAKFGAVFTGIGLTQSPGKYKNVRNAIELVAELNRHTKFTLTPMRGHWNVYGTNQTFAYLAGYPYAIDYSRGVSFYNPGETSAVDMLKNKEVDSCIIIGSDPGAHFPRECNEWLAKIPTVVIDPFIALSTALADVQIPVASVGIDAEGTGYRLDSVPMWLKSVLDTTLMDDVQVLTKIYDLVRKG
jgi:formylmethanofuran dehydrogenase subunit B